jgi:hypothetical protein
MAGFQRKIRAGLQRLTNGCLTEVDQRLASRGRPMAGSQRLTNGWHTQRLPNGRLPENNKSWLTEVDQWLAYTEVDKWQASREK